MVLIEVLVLLGVNLLLWAWVRWVPVRVIRVERLWKTGALGMALPGVIFLTPGGDTEHVLAHEEAHQQQMREWSPLGTALALGWGYLSEAVRIRVREKRWAGFWELWGRNPVERDAEERARKVLKAAEQR